MDYSKLSDFEINKRVGSAIGKELMPDDCQDLGLSGFSEVMLRNGDFKDYCNDPADAWPIIQESGISIEYDGIDWMAYHCSCASIKYSNPIEENAGKPLRAAMIVFLMMQESQHA
ncbi:DUF2591 domain-containing protein [Cronobacter dublinensis]|nr:DUF2591 domain-containing protein [Cronobacter dublinensis]ELY3972333.1 DUF2591 domain-containing protein [Cronobacter dublinensis]ELY4483533.1 DUF2591 domain-containing protein [Cronobacter dublinensis]ELY5822763.1 DUF2591 domain-containing protein [Cronobacter dublinensis]